MSAANKFNALLSRGHATAQEILEVGVGPELLRGATTLPPFPLILKPAFQAKTPLETWGVTILSRINADARVLKEDEPSLHIKTLAKIFRESRTIKAKLLKAKTSEAFQDNLSIMGHESVHVLQWIAFNLDRYLRPHPNQDIGASPIYGHGSELEAVLALDETPVQTKQRHHRLFQSSNQETLFPDLYLLRHNEIQAKLHQVLAASGWKHLPQNRRELAEAFKEAFETGKSSSKTFPINAVAAAPGNSIARLAWEDLREVVYDFFSAEQKKAFLNTALPVFYGSLLELYGDPEGKVKMGLEPSPVYARALAARILYEQGDPQAPRWTARTWRALAAHAEPETRDRLSFLAFDRGHSEALDAFEKTFPSVALKTKSPREKEGSTPLPVLLLGELHHRMEHYRIERDTLLQVKDRGYDTVCLELPEELQEPLETYLSSPRKHQDFQALLDETLDPDEAPHPWFMKAVWLAEDAADLSYRVVCVDASSSQVRRKESEDEDASMPQRNEHVAKRIAALVRKGHHVIAPVGRFHVLGEYPSLEEEPPYRNLSEVLMDRGIASEVFALPKDRKYPIPRAAPGIPYSRANSARDIDLVLQKKHDLAPLGEVHFHRFSPIPDPAAQVWSRRPQTVREIVAAGRAEGDAFEL